MVAVTNTAALTLTRQPHARRERSRPEPRRDSSARCSKHASRHINPAGPLRTPFQSPFVASTLRRYDTTTCDPSSEARFLNRDPLESVTREAYAYVGGNPLNATDPTGMFTIPGTNICVDIGDPNCNSIAEHHPVAPRTSSMLPAGYLTSTQ